MIPSPILSLLNHDGEKKGTVEEKSRADAIFLSCVGLEDVGEMVIMMVIIIIIIFMNIIIHYHYHYHHHDPHSFTSVAGSRVRFFFSWIQQMASEKFRWKGKSLGPSCSDVQKQNLILWVGLLPSKLRWHLKK